MHNCDGRQSCLVLNLRTHYLHSSRPKKEGGIQYASAVV